MPENTAPDRMSIERAKRLLLETDYSIDRIAEIVGFTTGSYFVQCFHSEMNTTPSKFRKKMRTG